MKKGQKKETIMSKKNKTTSERWLSNPEFKKEFDNEYEELLLSELILALMEEDKKSVRKLAGEIGVSKTIIQNLRSGKQSDMKLSNFINLANVCGYSLVLERENRRIPIKSNVPKVA